MKLINISSTKRNELIDITSDVKKIVLESGIEEGICIIFVPHTTAAVTINENADPDVKIDILAALDEIIPEISFKHSEGNSDSHIKSSLVGNTQEIFIKNKDLQLGTWQGILFCEFDGPRQRKVWVEILEK